MAGPDYIRTLILHRDDADNASIALHGLVRWAENRELMRSPVLLAMLEHAKQTAMKLEAALRMAERGDRDGQPADAAELERWLTVEETLEAAFGVKLLPVDRRLAALYACERFAWQHRPANFRSMTHEQVEAWALTLAAKFQPHARSS